MAEQAKPKKATAGDSNPFPAPEQQHQAFGSILNLLAVALAEGSGDPQVKQQVLQDLAGQRQAREEAIRRRREFEADLILIDKRAQAQVDAAIQEKQRTETETKTGAAEAMKAEEFMSPHQQTLRLGEGQLRMRGQKAEVEGKEFDLQQKQELGPMVKQGAELELEIQRLDRDLKQAQVRLATDPENIALQNLIRRLEAQKTIAETEKLRAEARSKGRGGAMTRQQVQTLIAQDPRSAGRTPGQNAKLGENLYIAGIMPSWLASIPETSTVMVKDINGKQVAQEQPVAMVTPGTNGQPGAMPPQRKVEITKILDEIGGRIGANMHVSTNEQRLYSKALEDIMTADPSSIDVIFGEMQQQLYTNAGYEEPSGPNLSPENIDNMSKVTSELFARLRSYGVSDAVMSKIRFSLEGTAIGPDDEAEVDRANSGSMAVPKGPVLPR